MESILTSVKQMLGITEDYKAFDVEIMIHINSVLTQLGQICPWVPTAFTISGKNEKWSDFVGDQKEIEFVKTYVYLKVRTIFDPPSGAVLDAMKETILEMEWRLSIAKSGNDDTQSGDGSDG